MSDEREDNGARQGTGKKNTGGMPANEFSQWSLVIGHWLMANNAI